MDMNETVRETLQSLNSDLINRGVTPSLAASPDLPLVIGDSVQIKQVMLNLIVNACDAMRDDDRVRLLAVRTVAHADGSVGISVSDSGGGVPEAALESIFNPFGLPRPKALAWGWRLPNDHPGPRRSPVG